MKNEECVGTRITRIGRILRGFFYASFFIKKASCQLWRGVFLLKKILKNSAHFKSA
jgi:hypothetical protein